MFPVQITSGVRRQFHPAIFAIKLSFPFNNLV